MSQQGKDDETCTVTLIASDGREETLDLAPLTPTIRILDLLPAGADRPVVEPEFPFIIKKALRADKGSAGAKIRTFVRQQQTRVYRESGEAVAPDATRH